jgi:hypothetical protein
MHCVVKGRLSYVIDGNVVFDHKDNSVDFRPKLTQHRNIRVKQEANRQQRLLLVRVRYGEISGQEHSPHEERRGTGHEDIARIVEVVW